MSFLCPLQTDILILGQGLAGTLLSLELTKLGHSYVVMDSEARPASSRVAIGLINPVTGKRLVKSWLYETFLRDALNTYASLEEELGIPLVRSLPLLKFHATREEDSLFCDRVDDDDSYLHIRDSRQFEDVFQAPNGVGEIGPCYLVDGVSLISAWRERLKMAGHLRAEEFSWNEFRLGNEGVCYRDIHAKMLICCEGAAALGNPYFSRLPFSLNKGETVLARIPGLNPAYCYDRSLKIVPVKDDLFRVGSSFDWEYKDLSPTATFKERVEAQLRSWLKLPFDLRDQAAGERPSSADYRPFLGFHPLHPQLGVLNGLGTKGFLQAPHLAAMMASHLVSQTALMPEVSISRFTRILSR